MLDGLSLDQLRTFIAAADEGRFTAAGKRLRLTQSVVSETLANLEGQIGIKLFDRSKRLPVLTPGGQALLAEARAVAAGMDLFRARAKVLAGGLEPELSVVIDVMFPIEAVTCTVVAFQERFPTTPLRLYVEALGAVVQPVLDGRCSVGVVGTLPLSPCNLTCERLLSMRMVTVASPKHPLARHNGPVPASVLSQHVQLVLTDRSSLSEGRDFGVLSPRTWRLADLGAKHAFLRAGLGWGGIPMDAVRADLADGRLAQISLEDPFFESLAMPMSAIYRTDDPPGPAGRWFVDRLKQGPAAHCQQ